MKTDEETSKADEQPTDSDQPAQQPTTDDQPVPDHRMCGTMEVHNRILEERPECRARRAEISSAIEARLSDDPSFRRTCGLTTIPVVVHVVYDNDTGNISDDQVTSQIDALSRDYRANNSDTGNAPTGGKNLPTDALIQFKMATTDPDGNATDVITRTKTHQTSFRSDHGVKSSTT